MTSFKNQEVKQELICGLDEAGRGPVLGPMVICGVCFHKTNLNLLSKIGVRDSKKLTVNRRSELIDIIVETSINVFQQLEYFVHPYTIPSTGRTVITAHLLLLKHINWLLCQLIAETKVLDLIIYSLPCKKRTLLKRYANKNIILVFRV